MKRQILGIIFILFFTTVCAQLKVKKENPFIKNNFEPLIVNEINAVEKTGYLKSNGFDTYFGRLKGNGDNWIELVILEDNLNIKNWEITIKQNGGIEIQKYTIPDNLVFEKLKSGTIITLSSTEISDYSYAPENNDWWININIDSLITTNNETRIQFKDGSGRIRTKWCGEGISPLIGIDSEEVFKLKDDPYFAINPSNGLFGDDNDSKVISTFGAENQWVSGDSIRRQDFYSIRNQKLEYLGYISTTPYSSSFKTKDIDGLELISSTESILIADDDEGYSDIPLVELSLRDGSLKNQYKVPFFQKSVSLKMFKKHSAKDVEALAYDSINDALYVFSGTNYMSKPKLFIPGQVFKLKRDNKEERFVIDTMKFLYMNGALVAPNFLDNYNEHTGAVFINGSLYVIDGVNRFPSFKKGKTIIKYNFVTNTYGSPLLTFNEDIYGLDYNNGFLYITSSQDYNDVFDKNPKINKSLLYKYDWTSINLDPQIFNLLLYGIRHPTGVVEQNGILYITDGIDSNILDLGEKQHAIHLFKKMN